MTKDDFIKMLKCWNFQQIGGGTEQGNAYCVYARQRERLQEQFRLHKIGFQFFKISLDGDGYLDSVRETCAGYGQVWTEQNTSPNEIYLLWKDEGETDSYTDIILLQK